MARPGLGGLAAAGLAWAAACAASGCAPSQKDLAVFLESHKHVTSAGEYRLAPPDVIAISATLASEVDGEVQRIRTDGKVSLRLLGEVKVAGLTPKEVGAKLEQMLVRYYVGAKVNVRVVEYRSKRYYVFGQVRRSGPQPYTGRDTLLQALAVAEPTFLAWNSQIKLIRPSPERAERHAVTVDLDRMMGTGDMTVNVLLAEGDILYVPPTPLAWVGLRLRELLFPITPAASAVIQPAQAVAAADAYDRSQDDDSDDGGQRRIFLVR
jgi:polysaccharide export outer membrane protein